jgi:hypothetical protein
VQLKRGKVEKSFEFVVFWIEADHVRGFMREFLENFDEIAEKFVVETDQTLFLLLYLLTELLSGGDSCESLQ